MKGTTRAGRYHLQPSGHRAFIPTTSASKRCAMTATGRAGWGTYPAVNQLVRRFVEQKILRETTGQARHRRFQYDGYVRLFTEEDNSSAS